MKYIITIIVSINLFIIIGCEEEKAEPPMGTIGIEIDVYYRRQIYVRDFELYVDDILKESGEIDWTNFNLINIEASPGIHEVGVVLLDHAGVWVASSAKSVTVQKDEVATVEIDSFVDMYEPTPTYSDDFSGMLNWGIAEGNWSISNGRLNVVGEDDGLAHVAYLTNNAEGASTTAFNIPFSVSIDFSGEDVLYGGIGISSKDGTRLYLVLYISNDKYYLLEWTSSASDWQILDTFGSYGYTNVQFLLECTYWNPGLLLWAYDNSWSSSKLLYGSTTPLYFDEIFLWHEGTVNASFDNFKFYGGLNNGSFGGNVSLLGNVTNDDLINQLVPNFYKMQIGIPEQSLQWKIYQ